MTLNEARAAGAKRYFTGSPCLRGHVAERHVSTMRCLECVRENRRSGGRKGENKRRYYRHREHILTLHYRAKLKGRYGITPQAHEALIRAQDGKCAICKTPERSERNSTRIRLSIDHCHDEGYVRGLLCNACNTGLGKFGDDPAILIAAARYLRGSRRKSSRRSSKAKP
jgi:Recombination endonuclease VII